MQPIQCSCQNKQHESVVILRGLTQPIKDEHLLDTCVDTGPDIRSVGIGLSHHPNKILNQYSNHNSQSSDAKEIHDLYGSPWFRLCA